MTVAIICDGEFPRKEFPRYIIYQSDFIICCDGALLPFLKASPKIFGTMREPDLVIGDMDSLKPSLRKAYEHKTVHVTEQDNNDMTKAFIWVMENLEKVEKVYFLGAGGKREDHTVGNLSLMMEYARRFDLDGRGITIEMVSDYSTAFPVTDSIEFWPGKDREISIFSPDNSLKIHSEGLLYPTDEIVFDNWWKATLNTSTQERVSLIFNHPAIALIVMS